VINLPDQQSPDWEIDPDVEDVEEDDYSEESFA
jgi:hypothetical protein